MKNVAVTGAGGFLGRKIIERLLPHPEVNSLLAIDIKPLPQDFQSGKLTFYQLDIRDKQLAELFAQYEVDTVFHLAFVVNPIRNLKEMESINVEGSKNVLNAVVSQSINHLLVSSSTSAFGAFPDHPTWLTEDTPVRKHNRYMYARNKYEVEKLLETFVRENPHIKTSIIRPCIICGPQLDNYVSRMLVSWPFLIQIGRRRPYMQFVHEEDVVDMFMMIFENEFTGIYHCVGEGVISTEEIAKLAGIKILPLPPWIAYPLANLLYLLRFPGVEARAGMLDFIRYRWTASDEITRDKLGFKPRYSSEQVVKILIHAKKSKE